MGFNVFEMFAKLALDSADFIREVDSVKDVMSGVVSATSSLVSTSISGITDIVESGVKFATEKIGGFIKSTVSEVAAYGDNIDKASQKLGISAEAYQEWDAIMRHSGTSVSTMTAATKTLANAITNPSEKTAAAFDRIGISMERAASLSQEDLFSEVVTKLQAMESGTEKTALASSLLGRSAMEMGALLNTSAEDTEKMRQRVHELGGVMSDEAVKASAAYQDALQDMQTAFSGVKRGMATELMPALTDFMNGIGDLVSGNDEAVEKISKALDSLIDAGAKVADGIIETATKLLPKIFEIISKNVPVITSGIARILGVFANAIVENLPVIAESAGEIGKTLIDGLLNFMRTSSSAIRRTIIVLGKELPGLIKELIPEFYNALGELLDAFTSPEVLDNILEVGGQLLISMLDGILRYTSKLGEAAVRVVTSLAEYLANNAEKLAATASEMIADFAANLKESNTLSKLVSAAIKIVESLASALLEPTTLHNIIRAGLDLMIALANALSENIGEIIAVAGQIIHDLYVYFTTPENVEEILLAGMEIILAIVDGLGDAVHEIFDFIGTLAKDIADYFGIGDYWQAGRDVIDQFMGGVLEKWEKWKHWWEGVGEFVYDALHDEEGNVDLDNYAYNAINAVGQDTSANAEVARQNGINAYEVDLDKYSRYKRKYAELSKVSTAAAEAYRQQMGFATGGIVTRPVHALIGEAGAEAIVPLEKNTGWLDGIAERLNDRMTGQVMIQFGDIYVSGDADAGKEVAEQIDRALRELQIQQARGIGGTAWKR